MEIVGPIPVQESHRFLVLMSSGLCKTLKEIYNSEQQNINREFVQIIVQQFRTQASLAAVAQTVIDKIVSQHFANYMQQTSDIEVAGRADVTLLIRNFNFPMPNETRNQQNQVITMN